LTGITPQKHLNTKVRPASLGFPPCPTSFCATLRARDSLHVVSATASEGLLCNHEMTIEEAYHELCCYTCGAWGSVVSPTSMWIDDVCGPDVTENDVLGGRIPIFKQADRGHYWASKLSM